MNALLTKLFQLMADFQQNNGLAVEYLKLLGSKALLFGVLLLLIRIGAKLFKSHGKPPYQIPWGLRAVAEIFFIFLAFQAIAIYFKQPLAGGDNLEGVVAVWSVIEYLFLIVLIWYFVRHVLGSRMANLGWIAARRTRDMFIVLKGLAYVGVLCVLTDLLYWTEILERSSKIIRGVSFHELISEGFFSSVQIGLVLLVSPVCEETLYRGFIYPVLRNRLPAALSAILISIFFAAVHFDPSNFILIFLMSMGATMAYEKSRWIGAPIAVHAFYNALVLKGLFAY